MISLSEVSAAIKKDGWKIHVEREVMDNPKFSCGARTLYAILRGYQGKNCKEPFPGIDTLQCKVGVRDAIYGYLKELYQAGLIRRIKDRSSGAFCKNRYEFLEPSPHTENRGVVETSILSGSTGHHDSPTRINAESPPHPGLPHTANPYTKESHPLKESQEERDKVFPFDELVRLLITEFPDKPVKRSLSRMVAQEGWALTLRAGRKWLGIELEPNLSDEDFAKRDRERTDGRKKEGRRRTEQERDQERTGLVYTGGIKKL